MTEAKLPPLEERRQSFIDLIRFMGQSGLRKFKAGLAESRAQIDQGFDGLILTDPEEEPYRWRVQFGRDDVAFSFDGHALVALSMDEIQASLSILEQDS